MTISKSKKVYKLIKNSIVDRRLAPGTQLKENELSEKLDISRTPIRQAFTMLENEGLVENIPNRGTYVINPTAEEMIAANEMRLTLEKMLANEITENITDKAIEKLEFLVNQEVNYYKRKQLLEYLEINKKFHMTLANLSNNKYLIEAIDKMLNVIHVHLILYDKFFQVDIENLRGLKEHKLIVKYLKEKNSEKLKEVMIRHIENTLNELKDNKIKNNGIFENEFL